jgi:2-C-methyl-D-erythritol 2,4-cyclodiphosphate synthase
MNDDIILFMKMILEDFTMRIGMGYDVHRLVEGRDLIVGGVRIPHETGLLGHSDADVLVHAIMDALIGALGKGDIGKHFPDTDERFKGADSMGLLSYVKRMLEEDGYSVINIDCVIIAQKPKMAPFIPQMKSRVAEVLGMDEADINIKATTEEGLGFTGALLGISSQAVALIDRVR